MRWEVEEDGDGCIVMEESGEEARKNDKEITNVLFDLVYVCKWCMYYMVYYVCTWVLNNPQTTPISPCNVGPCRILLDCN